MVPLKSTRKIYYAPVLVFLQDFVRWLQGCMSPQKREEQVAVSFSPLHFLSVVAVAVTENETGKKKSSVFVQLFSLSSSSTAGTGMLEKKNWRGRGRGRSFQEKKCEEAPRGFYFVLLFMSMIALVYFHLQNISLFSPTSTNPTRKNTRIFFQIPGIQIFFSVFTGPQAILAIKNGNTYAQRVNKNLRKKIPGPG